MDPAASRGTFTGAFSGGPTSWNRTLQVTDNENPGDGSANAWINFSATNRAGRVITTITTGPTYVIGGFVARDLTYAAFATSTNMNVPVTDFAKLTAGIFTASGNAALKQSIGTSPPVVEGYTIDALGINPTAVIWLDTARAATNSTGTAQITDVEETV